MFLLFPVFYYFLFHFGKTPLCLVSDTSLPALVCFSRLCDYLSSLVEFHYLSSPLCVVLVPSSSVAGFSSPFVVSTLVPHFISQVFWPFSVFLDWNLCTKSCLPVTNFVCWSQSDKIKWSYSLFSTIPSEMKALFFCFLLNLYFAFEKSTMPVFLSLPSQWLLCSFNLVHIMTLTES